MICSSDIDTGIGPVDAASTDVFTLAQAQDNWWTRMTESKAHREERERDEYRRSPQGQAEAA